MLPVDARLRACIPGRCIRKLERSDAARSGALLHPCGVFDRAGSEGAEALNDCLIAATGKGHLRRLEFPEDFYVAVHFCSGPFFCYGDEESGD